MKFLKFTAMLSLTIFLWSCDNDDSPSPEETGSFQVYFDNKVGSNEVNLTASGDKNYQYETANGEKFNVSMLGYYVSKIVLEGPNGEYYADEMDASAADSKGYYHVMEGESATANIQIENVPAGTYDRVTFTIGVEEDGVQEGAAGGVLDPANGGWFWNWNAGYIGFAVEGTAENSQQEYVDWGNGASTEEKTFALHVGGWKDVADNENFVNNVRTVTLDFGTTVTVGDGLSPMAHVVTDVLKMFDATNIDFNTTYSVHAPKAGAPFANVLEQIFVVHHVHQSTSSHD
ncbi:MbnP family protein [Roseivirga pacifica]|uniref:MbnP family protein n=1 Tax=Roseivirga pacifica TaxID=1267423 RepID=UPI0020940955|nr:MbnP family protein [Roseivirga pacifica]MCO6360523.1 hypothetical protein [Roseivirga pacifica]MCO6368412.1 hypothetical protein [Roseivirga pacifica]MCO6372554.1 hypothetical protein [Roseivirga pacifica]MCO6376612.1 hypothetical protein [Roseivirga pacifica]MCO6378108.1 hypothetical protein [Roseivirga pacifica]